MKILHVVSYFYPAMAYGGTPRVAYDLSREMVKRGHEVSVYTTDTLNPSHRLDTPYAGKPASVEGIQVYYFKTLSNKLVGKHHLVFAPSFVRAMCSHCRDFDVVHLHEPRTLMNISAYSSLKRWGIPYILQPHGALPRIEAKYGMNVVYDTIWGKKILRDASMLIPSSQMEVEQCQNLGINQDKIVRLPNGIHLQEFKNLPRREEFRQKYGLNNDEKVILFLGRIHRIKGIDLLIRAFIKLQEANGNNKLVISGHDDGYLIELKRIVRDRKLEKKVILTGPLYGREKLAAFTGADVYVLPSIYEIFGITLLEAGACGTPVITTDQCGLADVINGRSGLVVPRDVNMLKDALLQLLSDGNLRSRFGEEGRRMVQEEFDWAQIAKHLENIYQNVYFDRNGNRKSLVSPNTDIKRV